MPDPVFGKHIPVQITKDGRNSIPIPNGAGRKVAFNNGQNDPVYVAFGDKNVVADEEDAVLDFGYSEMMIPDDAAYMGFSATVDRGIVCAFAFQGRQPTKPTPIAKEDPDPEIWNDQDDDEVDEVDEEDKRSIAPKARARKK